MIKFSRKFSDMVIKSKDEFGNTSIKIANDLMICYNKIVKRRLNT
jgi:hypothetical protein